MHIWDDNQSSKMHHHKLWSLKKMDYSHCPLKKRPVHFVKNVKEEMDFGNYTLFFSYLFKIFISKLEFYARYTCIFFYN